MMSNCQLNEFILTYITTYGILYVVEHYIDIRNEYYNTKCA